MKKRQVIVTMPTLLEIMKDYTNGDIVEDATLVKVLTKDGRFRFVIESPSIQRNAPVVVVSFDINRIYDLGGSTNE